MIKDEDIAMIVHEANKAYCEALGDMSQEPWENAPHEIKDSAIEGVIYRLANPDVTPEELHDNWCRYKELAGWEYGKEKNEFRKTHNCLVDYDKLPEEQKVKDRLFSAIIGALIPSPTDDSESS